MGMETKIGASVIPDHFRHFVPPQSVPGLYYRWLVKPRWRGPVYYLPGAWLNDLQSVLFLLACMVKVGAPLPQGFDVAAVDAVSKVRLKKRTDNRILRMILLVGILPLVCVAVLAALYELYRFNDPVLAGIFVSYLLPIPLIVALFILPKTRKQAVLLHMRDRLESGCQLSEVMREMNRFFPTMYADLIGTAENTGRMSECIEYAQKYITDQLETRRQIRKVLIYMALYLLLIVGIINFMMMKVVPVFVELLREFSGEQHRTFFELELLIASVDFVYYKFPEIIISACALYFLLRIALKINSKTGLFSSIFLFVPVLRKYVIASNILSIGRHLEMLLLNATPLPQALQKASTAHINYFYKRALQKISVNVENGENLADAFSKYRNIFPAAFIDQIRLGIYTGQLAESMNQLNDHYQNTQRHRLKIFLDLLQPVATLFLALIVGGFLHCVFRCLTAIADAAVIW